MPDVFVALEKNQCLTIKPLQQETAAQDNQQIGVPEKVDATQQESIVPPAADMKEDNASSPRITEDKITGNISEINNVLSRLSEMDGTIESFFSEEQRELIRTLSAEVIAWLETETSCTPNFESVCHDLQLIIEGFIGCGLFTEANTMISAFNQISTGALKREADMKKIASDVLKNLASDDNINILFNEININDKNRTAEACQILFGFGDIIMNKLLNGVHDASDSKERIRIIHIIQEMGDKAIPAIRESININAPWYYLRNMAYILGRIGNETSVDLLRPLLLHKDKRVRMEAFKSINQTGGSKRGSLLLSVLPQAEKDLAGHIIDVLGRIKFAAAVPNLIEMLRSKSSLTREEQISLQTKICGTLASIGAGDAIPALKEIAESKSFFGLGSYPEEVRNAAQRALTSIKKTHS